MACTSVFVLGHRGMLGHVVAKFFRESGCQVATSDRRYSGEPGDQLLREARESGCSWVVNAIGLIKQKSRDPSQLYLVNTVLPHHLLQELGREQRLIHPSTDCVFSGRRGGHATDDPKDAEDFYGLSKGLGESIAWNPRAVVMRVSIIGPELGSAAGLFAWFMHQDGRLKGFTNHLWNGITTLEWSKAAFEIIRGTAPVTRGLVQLGVRDRVSKYELLCLFKEIWGRDMAIEPVAEGQSIDRTLLPEWVRPPIRQQLEELHAWITGNVRA